MSRAHTKRVWDGAQAVSGLARRQGHACLSDIVHCRFLHSHTHQATHHTHRLPDVLTRCSIMPLALPRACDTSSLVVQGDVCCAAEELAHRFLWGTRSIVTHERRNATATTWQQTATAKFNSGGPRRESFSIMLVISLVVVATLEEHRNLS
ncbi:hypothetical protein LMH87_000797 [Akanthomyces muscarius]|uniref:Uncharacterized protein n=1 Tax=Akanthomyces muscarius TaxID=2231603 RepID=A0A9W8QI23_AKAMU|nr:hypothetical protein LMH87_000797 [Akanthomyces muscarius]KAJ4155558.1 hypothetical protein LMH87_000797 [Akanthomyces muscarius]